MIYQPKGGMCSGCKHRFRDCSHLVFKDMPPIEITPAVIVVRCLKYERE